MSNIKHRIYYCIFTLTTSPEMKEKLKGFADISHSGKNFGVSTR
jgi:hypothetical protein